MHTVILSDLHLGNGGPYDIFAGADTLPALLNALPAPCRLVLNGDTADFLMNEDPLELDVARATAQARAIVAANSPTFAALGRLLAAGGELLIRVGNHDLELALPAVQRVFRDAFGPGAERLAFDIGDAPSFYTFGGTDVLITHGEHADAGNRFDRDALLRGELIYPAGSVLVKKILNPLKHEYGLRFMDLLKPDFRGAVLTALAVAPLATRILLQRATLTIAWRWLATASGGKPFAGAEAPTDPLSLDLTNAVADADLDPEEVAALEALGGGASFATGDPGFGARLRSAQVKLLRAGLLPYSVGHRWIAGSAGEAYFELEPAGGELSEARRLAKKYRTRVAVIGHTHAARWRDDGEVLYANTGTWIWQVRLPPAEADLDEWAKFLGELEADPGLEGEARTRLTRRLTGVTLDAHRDGGAAAALFEWRDGASTQLAAGRV